MKFHNKQLEVLRCIKNEKPKILICSGAKRAGKTFVLTFAFMAHVAKYENKGLSFILGGATQASIRRNILDDMEGVLGREIKLNKSNAFDLFGNKVYCFDGANSDSYKKARGFTAAGAFLNEATTLHDTFVKEVISRCSYTGARIYMDTNPENPTHSVKTDYIDKDGQRLKNGQLNIKAFNFTLYDNSFLDNEYVQSIEASTPSGMFFDRDILGIWVASEGVVYQDFDKNKNYINSDELDNINFVKYFAGTDWGWEHYGTIVLIGVDDRNNYYLIKEIAKKHKHIEYWIDEAKKIIDKYGDIPFYCDTARPDYIKKFREARIKAIDGRKDVIAGISEVASMFKTRKLKVVEDNVDIFKIEIYNYVWKDGKDEPVKQYDDVLDSLRYAIYSDLKYGRERTYNSR
ncbi:PBSX family phage terminase large subunit [Romboutsia ilealis]|uniref:PBSX family phage terminase large subunit n=1 Tax=Romboutsia ilealis TaxID=1115758 RepID=UPI0025B7589B|nr:PBSX family phage terminase large subunit [Romboutsia ilealis]